MCGAVHGADTTVSFGHFIDFDLIAFTELQKILNLKP